MLAVAASNKVTDNGYVKPQYHNNINTPLSKIFIMKPTADLTALLMITPQKFA
jgi:hypothetical protein